ncbi:MAG TPA: hypothetical protein VMY59_03840 [Candidatus Thermoplasmatota archaeon]|nr:hypothetical protein [Candidatus Thermoplasmatota archaeon]
MGKKSTKKQIIQIGIIVLLVCVGLSGCNQQSKPLNTEEAKFVGTWVTDDDNALLDLGKNVVFFSDRTMTSQLGFTGTYEVDPGNYLIVNITRDGTKTQHLFDYGFSNNGTTLKVLSQKTARMYSYTKQ